MFRGQHKSCWDISSTLTRELSQLTARFLSPEQLEHEQLSVFKRKIRGMRGANPQELSDDELWSLGQHYGLYTPLIDWTESPFIATFFSFEKPTQDENLYRAIYVLNRKGLEQDPLFRSQTEMMFLESLQDDNTRIISQAGLFTKLKTGENLIRWLDTNNLSHYITKIMISDTKSNRLDALNDLRLMNILPSTIYPDLTGAASACNMWFEQLSAIHELEQRIVDNTADLVSFIAKGERTK